MTEQLSKATANSHTPHFRGKEFAMSVCVQVQLQRLYIMSHAKVNTYIASLVHAKVIILHIACCKLSICDGILIAWAASNMSNHNLFFRKSKQKLVRCQSN